MLKRMGKVKGALVQTQFQYPEEVDSGPSLNQQQLKLKTEIIKSIPQDYLGDIKAVQSDSELLATYTEPFQSSLDQL